MIDPVPSSMPPKVRHPLSVILYVLAGFALVVTVLTLLYALNFREGVNATLFLVSAAFGPVADQIINALVGGVQSAMIVFSGMVLLIGVLLFSAGKLSARSQDLSQRVAVLEDRLASLESPS